MASKKTDKGRAPRGASIEVFARGRNLRELEKLRGVQWPAKQWQRDPVGFVREVLGAEIILPHQIDFLNAIARNESASVAIRAGQKVGKTRTVIWAALWFYCCFEDAQVVMTATNKEQVEMVLWRELHKVIRIARRRGFEIEEPKSDPASGLESADKSRILRGMTVRDIEAFSGISGRILFIIDEGSSLREKTFQAIEGNRIGGTRLVMISNPSRTEGPFFDIFHKEALKKSWTTFHVNSEDVAKYCAKRSIEIPGIAKLETIQEWETKYGRDSPFFVMRVLGNFLTNETGKVVSFELIEEAQQRWEVTREEGLLSIGVDPAGPGSGGDEWAFAIVRGLKLIALYTFRGLTEDAALEHLRGFLKQYRNKDETPRIVLDSEGSIGASFFGRLKAIEFNLRRTRPDIAFEVWGVKSGYHARRQPQHYELVRDELWANLGRWLRDGGALPSDQMLEEELNAVYWLGSNKEKLRATPKEGVGGLREKLRRSPDRADATCLAVWDPTPQWALDAPPAAEGDAVSDDDAWTSAPEKPYDAYALGEVDEGSDARPYDPYALGR